MPANQPYNKTLCRSAYGTDPILLPHCYLNDPVANTILLPTQIIIVPICIRYINQLIALIRLLSRPDRTIVLMCLRSNDQLIDRAPSVRLTITTCRWHRTATRIDKHHTDTPVELHLLTRPRADMPVSLNLTLAPYCYIPSTN